MYSLLSYTKARLRHGGEKGFSFLELVIVVAVIGILTSIAIPAYGGIQSSAKQAAVDANAYTAYKSVVAFQLGYAPTTAAPAVARLAAQTVQATENTRPKTADEILDSLQTEGIALAFLNSVGDIIDYPGEQFCVRAQNVKENEYVAFQGDCPVKNTTPEPPKDGEENPNPEGPGTQPGNPGTGEPGGGETTTFTLQCSATQGSMSTPIYGFQGSYKLTNKATGRVAGEGQVSLAANDYLGFGLVTANQEHELELTGTFPRMDARVVPTAQRECWRGMTAWGTDSGTTDAGFGFYMLPNLVEVPASIPTTVTHLNYAFGSATRFNQNIESWDLRNVTSMQGLFAGATSFNQPLDKWNVSNVTNMAAVFEGATAFDQPLNSWNTSKVTTMGTLFKGATNFNKPLANWKTGNVSNMRGLFDGATAFNQPLNSWNVGNVVSMEEMFRNLPQFNQPLDAWNTSKVTSMANMFNRSYRFNQNIDSWNTGNVADMSFMFQFAEAFNSPLGQWNTAKVTNMGDMFNGAVAFNQPLSEWDTSEVTNVNRMFRNTRAFSQDISNWDTGKVTTTNRVDFRTGSAMTAEQSPRGLG